MNRLSLTRRVEEALVQIVHDGTTVTVTAVAAHTRISRATLYRHPELIALINEHRARASEADTLTGLATDIAHLRTGIEAIAARVRQHEERLRQLERGRATGTAS